MELLRVQLAESFGRAESVALIQAHDLAESGDRAGLTDLDRQAEPHGSRVWPRTRSTRSAFTRREIFLKSSGLSMGCTEP